MDFQNFKKFNDDRILTFIGYKQTDRQTDKPNLYIEIIEVLFLFHETCLIFHTVLYVKGEGGLKHKLSLTESFFETKKMLNFSYSSYLIFIKFFKRILND